MKIEKLTAQEQFVVSANDSLSRYLDNLSVGRPATQRSWLYEHDKSTEVTLQRWIPLMKSANLKNSPYGEEFITFDLKQESKFGPQGEVPPVESDAAQEVIEALFSPSRYDNEEALQAYWSKAEEFGKYIFGSNARRLRPMRIESLEANMDSRETLDSNSGYPRFVKRKTVFSEEVSDAKSGKAYSYPAILLFRSYNGKLRPVWMYPMSMNLLELRFEQVAKQALRSSADAFVHEYVTPWSGFEDVKRTLTLQWNPPSPIVGGDTTAMDAHMRKAQMRLFFEILKQGFQQQYWDDLYRAVMRTTNIPLLIGRNKQVIGDHGLASGAGFTQISETLLSMFLAWLEGTTGQGVGDDFTWNLDASNDEVVKILARLGLPAKPEKQDSSTYHLSFLQRYFRESFFSRDDRHVLGAYYPTVRALNSLCNPERFHSPKQWNSDMFCTRTYMILENCIDDPCFPEFLKFVVHGQKDLLPFAKQTSAQLSRIQQQASLIHGLVPSYNQEKRETKLADFTSIRMARELA